MRSANVRIVLGVALCLLLSMMAYSPAIPSAQTTSDDLTGIKVAVYLGNGVLDSSYDALTNMFEWMNATVEPATASRVLDDFLDDFDIVVFPGGSQPSYSSDLGDEGKEKIKDFVSNGGSFFGICGGSLFGAYSLHFFNGSTGGVYESGDSQHLSIMHINQSSTGPDLSTCPENVSVMWWSSSYFSPYPGESVIPIATYDSNGEAGMVAFRHHHGTVFLSSPHPEYEEGNDRDGTAFGDSLNDPDSEWELLLQVSKWLIEASPYEPTDPIPASDIDLLLIAGVSIGMAATVIVIALLYRRSHG